MFRLLILCLCCYGFAGQHVNAEEATTSLYEHCGNLQPQENFQMKLITGTWYVIQILQHKSDERYQGEKYSVSICPSIFLSYAPYSDTELKLFWEEDEGDVEYRFKIADKSSPGLWVSSGAQTGSLVQLSQYDQFAGTVHVRKAVSDHMVLTFCSPNSQLYSLIVARDKTMDPKDLRSISNHMQRLKLPITQTKTMCRSSSSAARAAKWLQIAALCFTCAYFFRIGK